MKCEDIKQWCLWKKRCHRNRRYINCINKAVCFFSFFSKVILKFACADLQWFIKMCIYNMLCWFSYIACHVLYAIKKKCKCCYNIGMKLGDQKWMKFHAWIYNKLLYVFHHRLDFIITIEILVCVCEFFSFCYRCPQIVRNIYDDTATKIYNLWWYCSKDI